MDSTRRHWRLESDDQDIAWLYFDQQGSSTNTLGSETLLELEDHLAALESSAPSGLVFASSKPGVFIAGADVHEFTRIRDREQALDAIRRGQAVMDRIEALPFPTVAVIEGHCLGGGLELALACRFRIASEGAALGLPEVRLGIHPGFGGTVRLPRLVGPLKAMGLMLQGRTLRAGAAAAMGLVDRVVSAGEVRATAGKLLGRTERPRSPPLGWRLLCRQPARGILAVLLRRRLKARASPKHYPAPYALIALWARYGDDERRMLLAEAESVARLIVGETAQNLIRVFFLQERLKALGKGSELAKAARVHVVGAGIMGSDIAAWCAGKGLEASVSDTRAEALEPARRRAKGALERALRSPERTSEAMGRLSFRDDDSGVEAADILVEAVVEDMEVKRQLFSRLEARARPEAILASNTSSIPLESIAAALSDPGRLVGIHFFNPVARMPLVEVVSGSHTTSSTARRAAAFVAAIGKLPVPVTSSPGFLVNRILTPYLLEAARLVDEGLSVETVDRAATDFGMPMGPLLVADTVGLDVCLSVAKTVAAGSGGAVPARVTEMVAGGHLGAKSGRGFYAHRKGRRRPLSRGITPGVDMEELRDRLILSLLNEAAACLREGVVADADLLDAGMIFGAGFAPFRGGPLNYARSRGIDVVVARLRSLAEDHGPRFKPDEGWASLEDGA